MKLLGTTKLRSLHAGRQGEDSPIFDPAFNCEGISGSLRPTSSVHAYARMNILPERNCTRLRYAVVVDQLASGKLFKLAKVAQRNGTNIAPARHAFSQLVPANAVNANRRSGRALQVPRPAAFAERLKGRVARGLPFSIAPALHLMFDCCGLKGLLEVRAFRVAILELGQVSLWGMHVGRTWSCIGPIVALMAVAINKLRHIMCFLEEIIATVGCRSLKQACNCMFHRLSAGMTSAFSAVAYEQTTPPHSRRLLGSHPEKLRNTVNPDTANASRGSRTRDGFNWSDVWPLGDRFRQRQEYVRLMCTTLYASDAVGSSHTAVTTV